MAKRRPRTPSPEPELVRRDGGLCVAFVNTASAKRTPIESYGDLLAWGRQCGALDADDARRLEQLAEERPMAAGAALRRARGLRDRVERILRALAAQERPADDDLDELNALLAQVTANRRLVPAANYGYLWGWAERDDDLDRMLWPVVLSVAEILTTKYCRQVRQCAGDGCDLLFVDRTPGSPRKWCDIEECGRPVRSRKYYRRKLKQARGRRRARIFEEKLSTPPE